jgi:hypothetical protein
MSPVKIEAASGVPFDGAFEPFTSTIWFIEAPYQRAVGAVQEWRNGLPGTARFDYLTGPLETLLGRLEPWAMPSWKELIVATRGGWTALFSQGSDVYTFNVVSWRLKCRSLRTNYAPHVVRGGNVVSYGDTAFWLGDGSRDDLGPLYGLRSVQASNQDGWVWELHGEPQLFEEPALYANRAIKNRFDLAALNRYCAAMGIERAEPTFYGPQATLVSLDTSGWPQQPRTLTSAQWQAENS